MLIFVITYNRIVLKRSYVIYTIILTNLYINITINLHA
jgi:hypothetical protein